MLAPRILQICVSRRPRVCLINSRRNKYGRAPFHFYCPAHSPGVINSCRRCVPSWIKSSSNRRGSTYFSLGEIPRYYKVPGEREKISRWKYFPFGCPSRSKNNGSFGKISILMAMFASVDYANQFGRAVRADRCLN